MKETVLELVQDCLSEMGSDRVNSIDDSTEAQRVAQLLKSVYLDLVAQRTFNSHKKLINLSSSGNNLYPNYLLLPEEVTETYWIRYNTKKVTDTKDVWTTLKYLHPDEFIYKVNQSDNSKATVDTVTDWDGTQLHIRNNKAPQFWTSFDDSWIVTDSYDSAVDTTLQSSKSQANVLAEPSITIVDEFVVDLPTDAFSLLRTMLKNRAFEVIKQMPSSTIAAEEQRQRMHMSRSSWRAAGGVRYPNYGRGRRGSVRNPTFKQDRD